VEHRYTRNEVERMMGVTRRELDYWTRLRLVLPRARWGERFFNFSDLVALETIKRLAARKVPARRIRRAVNILQSELGSVQTPLSMLRISTNGKQVVVYPPVAAARPFEPLTGQFVLNFETSELAKKIHAMASRSAEEWFEFGMMCDSNTESLEQAAQRIEKRSRPRRIGWRPASIWEPQCISWGGWMKRASIFPQPWSLNRRTRWRNSIWVACSNSWERRRKPSCIWRDPSSWSPRSGMPI
jgi:DNA-binding transcriptional MerR regulator